MAYTPQYIAVDDVPVQMPDDFSQDEKLDAIETAEAVIELDLNDGQALRTVKKPHRVAIKLRATCELAKSAESPDDTALGDLEDEGTNKVDYAVDAFCTPYEVMKDKIKAALQKAQSGPYVYNTSKSENREQYERFLEDIDVDIDEDFARNTGY